MTGTPLVHPKQAEAAERAEKRRKHLEECKAVVRHAATLGVHFVAVESKDYTQRGTPTMKQGRTMVAYVVDRRNVIAVSTAICHPDDEFVPVIGKARAAIQLANGQRIFMRVSSHRHSDIAESLRDSFAAHKYRI